MSELLFKSHDIKIMNKEKKTLHVMLAGGPGTGKSTMAAALFADLKWQGIDTEIITEYAKELVWDHSKSKSDGNDDRHGINPKLKNQIYIFAKQHAKHTRLDGKLDVVITDSPLVLGLYYGSSTNPELDALILSESKKFDNLYIFLNRKKKYNPNGRMQTESEAMEIDTALKKILEENEIDYVEFDAVKESVQQIVDLIKSIL